MFFISFGNQYEKTKGKSLIYFDYENVIFFIFLLPPSLR